VTEAKKKDYSDALELVSTALGIINPYLPILGAVIKVGAKEQSKIEKAFEEGLYSSLKQHLSNRVWKNMQTLATHLIEADGYLPPEIVQKDKFMQAFATCTELAAKAENTKKVMYLFRLLMVGVIDEDALNMERDYDFYAQILVNLSITDVHILGRLMEFEEKAKLLSSPNPQTQPYWDQFLSTISTELSLTQEEVSNRLIRLGTTGTFEIFTSQGLRPSTVQRLTPLGRRLITWVETDYLKNSSNTAAY
jgi:hypothetical protein